MRAILGLLIVAAPFAIAQPSTVPTLPPANAAATQQALEYRRVVVELRAEVAGLRAELAALRKENEQLKAKVNQAEEAAKPQEIRMGMSIAEAADVYRRKGWEREEESEERSIGGKTVTFVTWISPPPFPKDGIQGSGRTAPSQGAIPRSRSDLKFAAPGQPNRVGFRDGVVVRIEKS